MSTIRWLVYFFAAFCAVSCGLSLLLQLSTYGGFIDEVNSVQLPLRLLTDGYYSCFPSSTVNDFAPMMSIGIVSSFPSTLAWMVSGSILFVRIISVLYPTVLLLGLSRLVLKDVVSQGYRLAVFLLVWAMTVRLVPYSYEGLFRSLGEMSGAMILGLGFYLLHRRHARWGSFVLGLCVWHTKFIFLPFALLGLATLGFEGKRPALLAYARELAARAALFVVPMLAWLGLILVRMEWSGFVTWVTVHYGFVRTGGSGFDRVPTTLSLAARLSSPGLEWVRYSTGTKLRVLGLLFIPIALLLVRNTRKASRDLFSLGLAGLLGLFAAWYFLWHPGMWIRHIQPAMLVGWAVILYLAVSKLRGLSPQSRWLAIGMFASLCFVIELGAFATKGLGAVRGWSRRSYEIYVARCATDSPLKQGPMDVPACVEDVGPHGFHGCSPN